VCQCKLKSDKWGRPGNKARLRLLLVTELIVSFLESTAAINNDIRFSGLISKSVVPNIIGIRYYRVMAVPTSLIAEFQFAIYSENSWA